LLAWKPAWVPGWMLAWALVPVQYPRTTY
jgi:hypothetical protein